MVRTLNTMAELRASRFGRPWPRHGLKLLFWFAKDYVVFKNDNQMFAKYNPKEGGFGFHHFQNRRECENDNCKRLLPYGDYPFYEVGNLHLPASKSMPEYVRKYNHGHKDTSNMDRLIISMRPDMTVDKVYVTQHEDLKSFDPVNTYCISRELLMIICGHPLSNFLEQAGYSTHGIAPRESGDTRIDMEAGSRVPPRAAPRAAPRALPKAAPKAAPGFWESYCTIL
ncbi:uncharacterized protein LOC129833093 [Salvelinus fontinalis]|uniref:uncharacterized protein LOC129833093 n=1 Tax=Salvelinus fontinalis TaxID=8038 RepID=UPI0024856B85|nr:uncharacterized protein LOC129833093 [Salvelinus fontinalis]XP_055753375.1 uncharacterized protein LOC129833093 [Salvelinus fontinalis]